MELSVVIPLYNCAGFLHESLLQIRESLKNSGISYEIVMVDDGSDDGTWQEIRRICGEYKNITAIRLKQNQGQHEATWCGILHARGNYIATIDIDLQSPVNMLPELLRKMDKENLDALLCRHTRKKQPRWREKSAKLLYRFVRLFYPGLPTITAFRIFRHDALARLQSIALRFPVLELMFLKAGLKTGCVDVEHQPGLRARSSYRIIPLVKLPVKFIFYHTCFAEVSLGVTAIIALTAILSNGISTGVALLIFFISLLCMRWVRNIKHLPPACHAEVVTGARIQRHDKKPVNPPPENMSSGKDVS